MSLHETVRITDFSNPEEEILVAELDLVAEHQVNCCVVLKREQGGPVFLAFYPPDAKEPMLVDPEVFQAAVRRTVAEIRLLRDPDPESSVSAGCGVGAPRHSGKDLQSLRLQGRGLALTLSFLDRDVRSPEGDPEEVGEEALGHRPYHPVAKDRYSAHHHPAIHQGH